MQSSRNRSWYSSFLACPNFMIMYTKETYLRVVVPVEWQIQSSSRITHTLEPVDTGALVGCQHSRGAQGIRQCFGHLDLRCECGRRENEKKATSENAVNMTAAIENGLEPSSWCGKSQAFIGPLCRSEPHVHEAIARGCRCPPQVLVDRHLKGARLASNLHLF